MENDEKIVELLIEIRDALRSEAEIRAKISDRVAVSQRIMMAAIAAGGVIFIALLVFLLTISR